MATEAHEAAAGSSAGMPQLDISTWGNQIFWLLVALVVIYFVLSRVALPRIGAVLAERSGTITNDLAAAEELKQKAVAAEKAYNDALAKARIGRPRSWHRPRQRFRPISTPQRPAPMWKSRPKPQNRKPVSRKSAPMRWKA